MNLGTNPKLMNERNCFPWLWPLVRALLLLVLLGVTRPAARAVSYSLEGQNKGDTNNWYSSNLQDWQELDFIPCRVRIDNGPVTSQTFTISFPHLTGTLPGFLDFFDCETGARGVFKASSNVVFLSPPVLFSPVGADWYYTFTVRVTNSSTATIQFCPRMAAGA